MNTIAMTPLLRHSVGFDRIDQLFDRLAKVDESTVSYPPYNIEKFGENQYAITMAVAGFGEEDLNIVQERETLTVSGKIAQDAPQDEQHEYLHKGIATRAFERKFNLADHVKVRGAELKNGLLTVALEREIPEEAKPKVISISNGAGAKKLLSSKK
tara:strand:- start:426 stop:893 length:468 start_codon:yes stop_codon:yes gene_type:complete